MDYIIAGLGNPGKKYDNTRHNAGFIAIDEFAKTQNVSIDKLKFKSLSQTVTINNKQVLLLKPQTFMNLSGEALALAVNFYKVPLENVIILVDDISLPVGKMRIRRSGSHGGQNGLRNISQLLGTNEYPRIKIGVGQKPHPDFDLADWVLSEFSKEDTKILTSTIENVCKALELVTSEKVDKAMANFN